MDKTIDHFELESTQAINQTGMFDVYKAKDTKENKTVVLKILKDEYAKDPEIVSRFREYFQNLFRNVRKAANLGEVFNISGDVGKKIYVVQEFVSGQPLDDYLKNNPQLKLEEFKPVLKQICDGLHSLHLKNICHYKLLPRNILIDAQNKVKIVGGGSLYLALGKKDLIKKLIGAEKLFIAPEIMAGKDKQTITPACDTYSLAKIIEILPFKSNNTVLMPYLDKNPTTRPKSSRSLFQKFDDLFITDKESEKPIADEPKPEKPVETSLPKEIVLEQVRAKPNQPLPFKFTLPDQIIKRPGIKIECTSLPPFAYFDANKNEFSWKPGLEHKGVHTIKFQANIGTEKQTIKLPILVKTGMVIKKQTPDRETPPVTPPSPTPTPPPSTSPYRHTQKDSKKRTPKPKTSTFNFKAFVRAFTWSYNLILFVAGAFAIVLFMDNLAIGFLGLGILECLYLLIASSSEGFLNNIDKNKKT
jgi:serine/threonine protein kinase